jgi:putative molybdopterin biosynthesis protein
MGTLFEDSNNPIQSLRLLKPQEVAGLLNVSRSFAYLLLQTGEIPVVRLGKSRRVKPQDLEEYIERNRHSLDD